MLQAITVTSPASLAVLTGCFLGIGFMVRFFIALGGDASRVQEVHTVDASRAHRGVPEAAMNPADHLATGVVRVTTALASNPRENGRAAVYRPHLITSAGWAGARESVAERKHR